MQPSLASALPTLSWVAGSFILLLIFERWIHRHLHGVSLLITGRIDRSIWLYAIVLLPGVILHEFSHWFTALILGVKTGRFSVTPRVQRDGSLTLGYVEYYRGPLLDPVRESIIGAAPLIWGTALIGIISRFVFALPGSLTAINRDALLIAWQQILQAPFTIIWLYLLFVISNAMLPSPSDRRAWPLLFLALLSMLLTLYFLNADKAMFHSIFDPVVSLLGFVGLAFTVTLAVDLLFMGVIALLETAIGILRGKRVDYH